ncbi:MAG TPA: hypothetical protein VGK74_21870 [Symbiobacteriaceae bacterium]
MGKFLGIIIIALGGLFLLKAVHSIAFLFLLVAAGLAIGAAAGVIGRWGYSTAVVFALLSIPMLFVAKTLLFGMALIFRLAPLLLVGFGIYVLAKAFR